MSKINLDHKTQFKVAPRIDQQLIGINDDCLIIQHFNINLALTMGWGATLFFWLIGFPLILFAIISPWMPPYGYRNGVEITSFIEKFSGSSVEVLLVYLLFYVFLGGGGAIALTLGMSYFNLRTLKKAFSPITFNRKTQTVSMYSMGKKEEVEWSKLSATILSVRYASGYVLHHSKVLQLNNVLKAPGAKVSIEGSLFVDDLDGDLEHDGTEGNWEYIRQFMEQGPGDLTIAASPVIGLNHLDKQPMYSYNVTDSLRGNWFWPILKDKDRHGIVVFFTYLYWPIKVVFFIPNLLTDWLWRRMCLRYLKDSDATPNFSMKSSDKPFLTSNDAERVITTEEASKGEDLSVTVIKKRLQEKSSEKPKQQSLGLALLISLSIYVLIYYVFFDDDLVEFFLGWFFD